MTTKRRTAIATALRALADAIELDDEQPTTPANDTGPEYVRPCELGVPLKTIKKAHKAGEVELYRVGRELRVRRADLERWLATQALKAPSEAPVSASQSDDDFERFDVEAELVRRGVVRRTG